MSQGARNLFLVWAGVVAGASFLATPVKFLAPGLELPVALEVGRVTFRALGAAEAGLLALAALLAVRGRPPNWRALRWPAALAALLVLQYGALLPMLGAYTDQVMDGTSDGEPGSLHWLYVLVEAAKLGLLLALGILRPRPPPAGPA